MSYQVETLGDEKLIQLFRMEENHFNDFKAKDITGKNLAKPFLPSQTQAVAIFM